MTSLLPQDLPLRRVAEFQPTWRAMGEHHILDVPPGALAQLAEEALRDVNFLLRPGWLAHLAEMFRSDLASPGEREVARLALENAAIAARFELPLCQDTGTAAVYAWKGDRVWTGGGDRAELTLGIRRAYQIEPFRYSQCLPGPDGEHNGGDNLPGLLDLEAVDGETYDFLFVAKGGGSANKAQLFQQTPSILQPGRLAPFLIEKLRALGTAACPPYRIAIAIGGPSPEACLKVAKLGSCGALDALTSSDLLPGALRDAALERELLEATRAFGMGAQVPGRFLAFEVCAVRLPRHGASCPIGLAVSCLADRQMWGRIDRHGVWLEALERDPGRFLTQGDRRTERATVTPPAASPKARGAASAVAIDLRKPMPALRAELSRLSVGTRLSLSGPLVVARDLAHARIKARLERNEPCPAAFFEHPIYYAGPAKTPAGRPSGAFGPTTAGRMDGDLDFFQARSAALITLAKGNRSEEARRSCRRHGGFYLGTPGGIAALIAERHIRQVACLDFEDLGMEALYLIEVSDFPAIVLIDDKGNDLFSQVASG